MKLFQRVALALVAATLAFPVLAADSSTKTVKHEVSAPAKADAKAKVVKKETGKKHKKHHKGCAKGAVKGHSHIIGRENADNTGNTNAETSSAGNVH